MPGRIATGCAVLSLDQDGCLPDMAGTDGAGYFLPVAAVTWMGSDEHAHGYPSDHRSTSGLDFHDARCGGVLLDRLDTIVTGGCCFIQLAGADDLVVCCLEIEHELAGGGLFALVAGIVRRVGLHRFDTVHAAGLGFVAFTGKDVLPIGRLESEAVLASLVLINLEFACHITLLVVTKWGTRDVSAHRVHPLKLKVCRLANFSRSDGHQASGSSVMRIPDGRQACSSEFPVRQTAAQLAIELSGNMANYGAHRWPQSAAVKRRYDMLPTSLPVEEFTTPDPVTADENMLIDDLQQLMHRHGIRHLPILRDNRVVGVISDRDLRLFSGLSVAEKFQVRAADIMAEHPLTVNAAAPLDEVAYAMSERRVGSAIVLDEEGQLLGIFTATDALNALIEIVREGRTNAG